VREFFAYHGVWAVGVRLLRSLSIRHKVLAVVALAALPVVPMSVFLVNDQSRTVEEAERRIQGAQLIIAVQALSDVLEQKARQLESGQPPDRDQLALAARQLRQVRNAPAGQLMRSSSSWEAVEPALTRLASGHQLSAEGLMEAVGLARVAIGNLRLQTVQQAGFLLTEDADRYAQALRAFVQLPRLDDDLWDLMRALRKHARAQNEAAPNGNLSPTLVKAIGRLEAYATAVRAIAVPISTSGLSDNVRAGEEELASLLRMMSETRAAIINDGLVTAEELSRLHADAQGAAQAVSALQTRMTQALAADYEAVRDQTRLKRAVMVGATLLSLALALYLFYSFYLVMRGGLRALTEQARRMATGDLTVRSRPRGVDEVAETMTAVSVSVERLGELLAQVRYGSGSVSQAAQQIANGNVDLRTRNHRTSEALQRVVDGVARYSAQLDACSVQVERVVTTVQALRLQSSRSRRQMDQLAQTLEQVQHDSQRITEAVSLIDNVAFRTNLLALNASVEASKAGEAGKGFAVVAQEVRSLAQRSAEAARRIGSIVSSSGAHVEQSGRLAQDTARGIAASDEHIDQIHAAMADVSSLTRDGQQESSAILEQVRELRETTEKNLGLVEQLANASHSLRSHGERLTHRLTHFKLG
jgi:methyl-accepting chemotaxis protein